MSVDEWATPAAVLIAAGFATLAAVRLGRAGKWAAYTATSLSVALATAWFGLQAILYQANCEISCDDGEAVALAALCGITALAFVGLVVTPAARAFLRWRDPRRAPVRGPESRVG